MANLKRGISEYWDSRYARGGFIYGNDASTAATRSFGLLRNYRVLEIGGGYGRNAIAFAVNGFECVSIDLSAEARRLGLQLKRETAPGASLEFVEGDAGELCRFFGGNCFDNVFSNFCLHLMKERERERVLEQAARVLVPGGRAVFSLLSVCDEDFSRGKEVERNTFDFQGRLQHFFGEEEIHRALRDAGFEAIRLEHCVELERIVSSTRKTCFWLATATKGADW